MSGGFTQEDPIGLAGGLNLYGFAEGDPINFSDPFGLAPCPPHCRLADAADIAAGVTPGMSTGVDAATLLTGNNPVTGESVGGLGGLVAAVGLLTPASGGEIRAAGKAISFAKHYFDQKFARAVKSADIWEAFKKPLAVKTREG